MIRLDHCKVKASGEKRGRSEQRKDITEKEQSLAKREKKSIVRRSEWRVRKVVWSRAEPIKQCSTARCRAQIRIDRRR